MEQQESVKASTTPELSKAGVVLANGLGVTQLGIGEITLVINNLTLRAHPSLNPQLGQPQRLPGRKHFTGGRLHVLDRCAEIDETFLDLQADPSTRIGKAQLHFDQPIA